jgi:CheY-like chemotaxis protein
MSRPAQAFSRHLVFALEGGEMVVQRGANLVEVLASQEIRTFDDHDRDHEPSDAELEALKAQGIIVDYDAVTVWLPLTENSNTLTYYFLDTHLSPPYLPMVRNLIQSADLSERFVPKQRLGRVAIMGQGGDPFNNLPDAENALTLLRHALGSELAHLGIARVTVSRDTDETLIKKTEQFADLVRETPTITLADYSVLLVEHDLPLAHELQMALESLGVQTRLATSGETALEILLDEEPDLAIVDLQLPDMHGYEVIAKIRKDPLTSAIPIIALGQHHSDADVVFALNVAKVEDYFVKPLPEGLLRRRLLSLLERRR